ncbi:MAG TPA: HNH endonuclease [Anaerolineales bacterium]|jgi:5-methylcytosine-specific restriction protein A|nr:HNH endonuclease [Anaerolineales bacterium]
MADDRNLTGEFLNNLWQVGAKHALYREDGKWYHQLNEFPGALFDANGYVVFATKKEYLESPYLQIQQDLHVTNGISSIPTYVRITENSKLQSISQNIKATQENKKAYTTRKPSVSANDLPTGKGNPKRSVIQNERIIRDTKVSFWVKYVHDYRCQICGETLQLGPEEYYAEAHHIKPLGKDHNGPDVIENVLCVCPNHHVLLDYGAIRIEKSQLRNIEGHEINDDYIDYHNSVIYTK